MWIKSNQRLCMLHIPYVCVIINRIKNNISVVRTLLLRIRLYNMHATLLLKRFVVISDFLGDHSFPYTYIYETNNIRALQMTLVWFHKYGFIIGQAMNSIYNLFSIIFYISSLIKFKDIVHTANTTYTTANPVHHATNT